MAKEAATWNFETLKAYQKRLSQITTATRSTTITSTTEQRQRELVELSTSSSRHSVSEQQPQDEETFAALGYLLFDNDAPIKITVNIKTKSIEAMEIAHEIIHNAKTHW